MKIVRAGSLLLGLALVVPSVSAQTSASYSMTETVMNAGGRPSGGTIAASASFRVTLDAIGDGVVGSGLASGSYKMAGGFVGPHRPPGEVQGMIALGDKQTFQWSWEPGSSAFDVYRDPLSTLPTEFGACQGNRISTASWADAGTPAAGTGWFYMVTGENALWEEGTLGYESNGTERPNLAPCP